MKILSLWQPWASLMAWGEKKIETRSWKYAGPLPVIIAIHAAKHWDGQLAAMVEQEPFRTTLSANGVSFIRRRKLTASRGAGAPSTMTRLSLPFGAVIAVGRMIQCRPTEHIRLTDAVDRQELDFGDYTPGRWAWIFDEVKALDYPEHVTGQRSVRDWEPNAEAEAIENTLL